MRIYVASLTDYNAGRLFGEWIDCEDMSADDIGEAVAAMLAKSPAPKLGDGIAEEWAIHDYDGFYGIKLGEWESFERIAELSALIGEHGPAFAAFAEYEGVDQVDEDRFTECYQGEWDTFRAFAENFAEECGLWRADFGSARMDRYDPAREWAFIAEQLAEFFDWDAYANSLTDDYYEVRSDWGTVYVFRRN